MVDAAKIRFSVIFLVFSFLMMLPGKSHATSAHTAYLSDEDIQNVLQRSSQGKRAHGIMASQRNRLMKILDGFLLGDTDEVRRHSSQLSNAMSQVAASFPANAEKQAAVWRAMSDIVEESRAVEKEAAAGNYAKAYGHYLNLTQQCVACHQVSREWGLLPQPSEEKTENKEPGAEAKKA